ncbi:hypothetical protein RFI_32435 [Reticulomyxa filosa]|uniref:Mannose-1-phosphate guanyltransferase C-terminal domain-containing protein n=1 Tax=Reticulomyxa filosa TaxID=46433 RepID=X6LUC6_RETFI|nr:hypothetical protein RFI_32435 [Reticulomyxa filosa]|eukprot:ETO04961.1 hypothetical protein RFI_32435 [Reticulomyxa filosa]
MYLEEIAKMKDSRLCPSKQGIIGHVIIDSSAKFSPTAVIGPDVVIGPNVTIGANVRIKNSTILANTSILDGAYIDGSIVGWKSRIGRWARLQALCILGEDVSVKDEVCLFGTTVCPHKDVKENHLKEGDVLL